MTTIPEEPTEYDRNKAQAEAQVEGWQRLADLVNLENDAYASSYHGPRVADRIERWVEERQQREEEGLLSVEVERTIVVTLCTGGPHCEVRWTDHGQPTVICYGWWGAGRYERTLTDDEADAMQRILGGDFDEVASMLEGR